MGLPMIAFKERADILYLPDVGARPEFHRLDEPTGLPSLPPCGLGHGDRPDRRELLGKPDQSCKEAEIHTILNSPPNLMGIKERTCRASRRRAQYIEAGRPEIIRTGSERREGHGTDEEGAGRKEEPRWMLPAGRREASHRRLDPDQCAFEMTGLLRSKVAFRLTLFGQTLQPVNACQSCVPNWLPMALPWPKRQRPIHVHSASRICALYGAIWLLRKPATVLLSIQPRQKHMQS